MFKKVDSRKKYSEMEKEVLDFWQKDQTFEKSVEQKDPKKYYSFYDGPPFITGFPHHGNLLSSVVKDCVPRYWTMKGYRIERRWGWDCHGLPAEHLVEKKLGVKSKKEIEGEVGIDKFNQSCFEETSKIACEWENTIARIGRWVEFKNAYKTMDKSYMESVWWAFKQLFDKGLIYEDVRVSLYCPRCSTPLSNFEIAMDNSYENDTDPSVFVKMKMKTLSESGNPTYFLAWTTTPWTLPANVALAVGGEIKYSMVSLKNQPLNYILATDKLALVSEEYEVIKEFSGKDLVEMEYEPIFPHEIEGGYRIIAADFVTTEDGTGIVHIAPAFGEDDFSARKEENLSIILNVDSEGKFTDGNWIGEKVWDVNEKIVQWLEENSYLFKKENVTHSYPHCHRCHSKLIYKAQDAWFVKIDEIRQQLIKNNERINWHPEFLKEGRFKKGIEGAPDWNISRDRYWGTAMPVWKCSGVAEEGGEDIKKCDNIKIFGSYEELKKASGVELDDYHRPRIDEVQFKCEKCGGTMKRIPQVFDCWMESGSMPFAQFHYPFENKEKFEKSFPTDFISEYIGQTRAWFYVMHVMATGVFGKEGFKNVITTGNIAGEDGRKMSKSLGNYTDPNEVLEKYSADALRFYFLSSPLVNAQNVNFSEENIKDIQRRMLGTLWNSYSFFVLYANVDKWQSKKEEKASKAENLLDKWMISELNQLIATVDEAMQDYDIAKATRPIPKFIDNLSNWYIRRSRRRFWKSESDEDKAQAYQTLWTVLVEFSKVLAPFCPFVADEIYKNLTGEPSVHLCDFPEANKKAIDKKLNDKMELTRKIIEVGLSLRAENKIKVRQPLQKLVYKAEKVTLGKEFSELIKEEVNVKEASSQEDIKESEFLKVKEEAGLLVGLETEITPALQMEGQMRELVRHIQQARKEAGYEVDDRIKVWYLGGDDIFEDFQEIIAKEVLAQEISVFKKDIEFDLNKKVKLGDREVEFWIKK